MGEGVCVVLVVLVGACCCSMVFWRGGLGFGRWWEWVEWEEGKGEVNAIAGAGGWNRSEELESGGEGTS